MTIVSSYDPVKQVTNGNTKSFTFDFKMLEVDYLVVYLETNGVQTIVNPTDYTINAEEVGGTVDFNVAPLSGSYVIITRNVDIYQDTPYRTSSGFPAIRVEENLDKLTAIAQQLNESNSRAIKLALGTTGVDVTLPNPERGKALIWNDEENKLINSDNVLNNIVAAAEVAVHQATQQAIYAKQDADAAKKEADFAAIQASRANSSQISAANSANATHEDYLAINDLYRYNPLVIDNVLFYANDWQSDDTYEEYPYKNTYQYTESLNRSLSSYYTVYGIVLFKLPEASSGNFCSIANFEVVRYIDPDDGGYNITFYCTIYAKEKPTADMNVENIAFFYREYNND